MTNSIPLRYDYMSHLPFFPAEGSKGCEIEEIRDPRGGYIHAKGQKIFTDLESSGHGKKDVGTLVSYRQDEGKTFPCKYERAHNLLIFKRFFRFFLIFSRKIFIIIS